jgi:hypothetical protein
MIVILMIVMRVVMRVVIVMMQEISNILVALDV